MTNVTVPLRGASKGLQDLADFAISQGWVVCLTRGGHVKFSKGGCASIYTSFSPSDHRAGLNARAQLRRAQSSSHAGEPHV
ncbi:MAG TPA: hypothetical protein VGC62_25445 [Pseudomonas sp.]|uniref:hypothetical protein n=1 Tax=Pseudomonas sp. TaxID=306 RepID=UPI002ED7B9D8